MFGANTTAMNEAEATADSRPNFYLKTQESIRTTAALVLMMMDEASSSSDECSMATPQAAAPEEEEEFIIDETQYNVDFANSKPSPAFSETPSHEPIAKQELFDLAWKNPEEKVRTENVEFEQTEINEETLESSLCWEQASALSQDSELEQEDDGVDVVIEEEEQGEDQEQEQEQEQQEQAVETKDPIQESIQDYQQIESAPDRETQITVAAATARDWWTVDLKCKDAPGVTPLIRKCMEAYGWDEDFALRAVLGYKQFLALIRDCQDWSLAWLTCPSQAVNNIWYQHSTLGKQYNQDCRLLVGRLIRAKPSERLSALPAEDVRDERTRDGLRERFGPRYDEPLWFNRAKPYHESNGQVLKSNSVPVPARRSPSYHSKNHSERRFPQDPIVEEDSAPRGGVHLLMCAAPKFLRPKQRFGH